MREFLERRGSLSVAHALRSDCLDNGNLSWKVRSGFGLAAGCQGEGAKGSEKTESHPGHVNGNRAGHKHELHAPPRPQEKVRRTGNVQTRESDSIDSHLCCERVKRGLFFLFQTSTGRDPDLR